MVRCARLASARRFGWAGAVALLAAALVLLTGCSSSPVGDTQTLEDVPATAAPLAGREVFASYCAACHGPGGEGQPDWHISNPDGTVPAPPLNGDGHTWHHGDGFLYRIVSQGGKILDDPSYPSYKGSMPAFGDRLSHEQIIGVITYLKSLWGDKSRGGYLIRESQQIRSGWDPFPAPEEVNTSNTPVEQP
ncbi:MAG: cytochrome c [Actinomycetia bacterium]|nr:cytochrome c [Actinomycetes bacterium]